MEWLAQASSSAPGSTPAAGSIRGGRGRSTPFPWLCCAWICPGAAAPHAHGVKLKNEDFSRDPEVVRAMNDDPLIAHEVQPTRTVAEMARADERLEREFPLITLPVLILHGALSDVDKETVMADITGW